jgi:secreted trypsin-like serine protease
MPRILSALASLMFAAPAYALTGNAPPAIGWAARSIVIVIDARGDLCTGTALARDLVLTAAHCITAKAVYEVKAFQTGTAIKAAAVVIHPGFKFANYAASRATADVALIKLASPLPDIVVPASLAATRRVTAGEKLTIAGFGVTAARTDHGLAQPRMERLIVTGTRLAANTSL